MYQIWSLIFYQQKIRWRRFINESPSFLKLVFSKKLYRLFFVTLLILCLFMLAFVVFTFARDGERLSSEKLVFFWAIYVGIIFLYSLKGIGKAIRVLSHYPAEWPLITTLPMTWKNIYIAILLGRSLPHIIIIWLISGIIIGTYAVSVGSSWLLALIWIITIPFLLIIIFTVQTFWVCQ